ncbi:MAG TPA: SRPBCC family protein [Burkholderiaceae bacterium]|nr:SRPBCC family protein [Burkholderiaceae bacterium]
MSATLADTAAGAARFELVSHWHLAAPVDAVWAALKATEQWPASWPYVRSVREVARGDEEGVGAVRHLAWGSRLPYGLAFEVEVVEMQRPRLLRGRARGQLNGMGTWELTPDGATTRVRYLWCVDLSPRWMRLVAPLAAPVFRWNHKGVMRVGAEGLAKHLGVRLLDAH